MAAVGLGVRAAEARLARAGAGAARCVVACDNSPASSTLAGVMPGCYFALDEIRAVLICCFKKKMLCTQLQLRLQYKLAVPSVAPRVKSSAAHRFAAWGPCRHGAANTVEGGGAVLPAASSYSLAMGCPGHLCVFAQCRPRGRAARAAGGAGGGGRVRARAGDRRRGVPLAHAAACAGRAAGRCAPALA